MKKVLALLALILLPGLKAVAQQDAILGTWWNEEKTSKIEVYKQGGKYYGKVIHLTDDTNADGSRPKVDSKNPDTKLRKRRVVGIVILKDLEWDSGDREWNEGEIYDPKTGNTYSLFARLQQDGSLYLKGYIGFSLIGRSTVWTRVK